MFTTTSTVSNQPTISTTASRWSIASTTYTFFLSWQDSRPGSIKPVLLFTPNSTASHIPTSPSIVSRFDGPELFPIMLIFSTVAKLCLILPKTSFISSWILKFLTTCTFVSGTAHWEYVHHTSLSPPRIQYRQIGKSILIVAYHYAGQALHMHGRSSSS